MGVEKSRGSLFDIVYGVILFAEMICQEQYSHIFSTSLQLQ